jgi:hypothetical protein
MTSITVDLSDFEALTPRFLEVTKKTLAEAVKQQAALMLRADNDEGLIKQTAPKGLQEAKKRGDTKVERDVRRVFLSRATAIAIADRAKAKGLKTAFRNKNHDNVLKILNEQMPGTVRVKGYTRKGKQVAAYTKKVQVSALNNNRLGFLSSVADAPERSVHKSRQGRFKEVRRNRWSQLVLSKGALNAYIAEIKSRVGTLKAGWRPAAKQLGVSLPPFVNGVTKASGSVEIKLDGDNPTVTMTNTVPNIDRILTKDVLGFLQSGRETALQTYIERTMAAELQKISA